MIFKIEKECSDISKDPLLLKALEVIIKNGNPKISLIQKRLNIPYPRVAQIVDYFESKGYISKANETGKRKILITDEEFAKIKEYDTNVINRVFEIIDIQKLIQEILIYDEQFVLDIDKSFNMAPIYHKTPKEREQALIEIIGNTARIYLLKLLVFKHTQRLLLEKKNLYTDIFWSDKLQSII